MKLNEFIDFENGIPPAKGCVLLAEPFLQDAHFFQHSLNYVKHVVVGCISMLGRFS